jgi:beta-galactosidase
MDENRRLGDSEEILDQVTSMVLRDRNHPSVILWSLCNEEPLQDSPVGERYGLTMKKLILTMDKTRLITCAMNGGYGQGLSNVVDLQGFNYHVGDYDSFHNAHPEKPIFGSETASTVCTRGIYKVDKTKGYVTAYDIFAPEWAQTTAVAWKPLAEKPFMAGGFVWTGFDYRGEPTPYEWPCISSHFGILDTCGFPKDSYWYYKSWWGSEPVLHLMPHWNWPGREGETIDVWAYTNCEQVELFLNGNSLGRKDVPALEHAEWKVAYQPGVLSAKGYRDGKQILEEKVETTGKPAALRIAPYVTDFKADGEDQVPVAVSVVDAKGQVVPTANNPVVFTISGPAVIDGVGNGDPSCHEPDKASKRSAFNGYCMAIVRGGDKSGAVTLTAESEGLASATVVLHTNE